MVKKINKVSKKKSLILLKKRGKQRGGTNFIPFTKELETEDVDKVYMTSASLSPKALFKDVTKFKKSNITIKGPKNQKYEIYYVDSRNIHMDPKNLSESVIDWAKTFFINDINEQGEIIANKYSILNKNIEDNIDEIKKALNENYSLIVDEIIESAKAALIKIQAAKAVKVTAATAATAATATAATAKKPVIKDEAALLKELLTETLSTIAKWETDNKLSITTAKSTAVTNAINAIKTAKKPVIKNEAALLTELKKETLATIAKWETDNQASIAAAKSIAVTNAINAIKTAKKPVIKDETALLTELQTVTKATIAKWETDNQDSITAAAKVSTKVQDRIDVIKQPVGKTAHEKQLFAAIAARRKKMGLGGKTRKSKKTRKHRGIIQTGGNTGRLRKGYKYSGKRLKNGMPEILKIKSKK